MMMLPIRLKLTLWYAALLALALIIFSGIVYAVMASTLLRNTDSELHADAAHVAAELELHNGTLRLPTQEEATDNPIPAPALISPTGVRTGAKITTSIADWLAQNAPGNSTARVTTTTGDTRLVMWPVIRQGQVVGHVLVWDSLDQVEDARQTLLFVFLIMGPALLLIAGLGGYLLARRALRPVTYVTEAAATISATDLQGQVPVSPTNDELSALATTFNAMIARLRSGVERERRFAADASHELRSPLAVIRAEATLALDRPRNPTEYQRVLEMVDHQTEVMEDLIEGLLLLARTDTLTPEQRRPVLIEQVIEDAIAQTEPYARAAGTRINQDLDEDLGVEGAPSLLARAVRNLLDNAIKVTPPGGAVHVHAYRSGRNAVIEVLDEGPGIAPEHLDHIFEPFYQVSSARTPGDSHGLGLAITRRVIAAHGGTVEVDSTVEYGARFCIILPRAETAVHNLEPVSSIG